MSVAQGYIIMWIAAKKKKKKKNIRNGQRDVTVKHTEKQLHQ